jgi:hypothetical protein
MTAADRAQPGGHPGPVLLPGASMFGRIMVSALAGRDGESIAERVSLRANEGIVIRLSPDADF